MAGSVLRNFTLALAGVLDGLLNLYSFVLLVAILLSWVNPDPYNPVVRFVRSATEPLLSRVRRLLPFVVLGGFDLSPLVVALGLQFLRTFLVRTLAELAYRFAAAGTVGLAEAAWLVARADGVELRVHARPGAKRSAITGLHGGALCVRIGARPVDGAANRELVEVLAAALGMPRDAVTVRAGLRGREKRVHVRGLGADAAAERLGPYVSIDKGGARD